MTSTNGSNPGASTSLDHQPKPHLPGLLPPIELTMKAVTWHGDPYHMTVGGVARPGIEGPDDVLVRISTAAICGTDSHTYHGILGGSNVPYVMGHEGVGIVTKKGANVKNLQIGDRVVIPAITTFEVAAYGLGTLHGKYLGGLQAEYVRVPQADSVCLHVPNGTEHEHDFVMLSDIFPTAWGTVTKSGFQCGDAIVVFGAGPVGLLCVYSALLRGASRVYCVDHVQERLDKAKELGAIPIDIRKGDPATEISKFEQPKPIMRAVDCVGFECVNGKLKRQEDYVINEMIKIVGNGGGIYVAGVYFSAPASKSESKSTTATGHISFPIAQFWEKGITISGGVVSPQDHWVELKELILSGKAKPSVVVDRIVPIAGAAQAYADFSAHRVGKVLIDFPGPATDV